MSIKAEFIVNVGPYQHVAVWIEGKDVVEFADHIDYFDDQLKVKLGLFQAELESWVVTARQEVLEGVHQPAVEAVQSLGATVVEVKDTPEEEREQPTQAVVRPWNRTQQAVAKAWEKSDVKPAALDDF